MDYQKYKDAKEYIMLFDKHRESIKDQRRKIKNGDMFGGVDSYVSFIKIRLQNLKEEFSRDLFYFNHTEGVEYLESHIISLRENIFTVTKNLRKLKLANPELFSK